MLDLYHASRDDLIELVIAQRDALAARDRRVAELEAELATQRAAIARLTERLGEALASPDDAAGDESGTTPRGMPGLKPGAADRPRRPRQRRTRGFSRRRMAPTARQVHALAHCPDCDAPLAGGSVKRTREVIELPLAPVVVTEHVYLERRCPDCGRRCVPTPDLDGLVSGQSRLGIGLVSLIVTLREEARLPYAMIQRLLETVHGMTVSVGALVGVVRRVAARAAPVVAAIAASIRASPVVHADETGWREDGHNGYIWTVSTPTGRVFIHGGRDKAMLAAALGPDFAGVLVSDFYGVYTSYDGMHQYCWAHLLRDVHDLTVQHRQDVAVRGWAEAVQDVFARTQACASPDPVARRQAARDFAAELRAICAPFLPATMPDGVVIPPQRTLCQRITTHLAALFGFVVDPAVPATNNAAERALRHLVVSRKISGGTRSPAGTHTKMTLASLFGTWRLQGRNPFTECQRLLASPQL